MKNYSLLFVLMIMLSMCKKDEEIYTTKNTTITQTPVIDTTFLLSVYPNPCNSEANFKLTCPRASSIEISIINVAGQTVYQNNGSMFMDKGQSTITITTQHLSEGAYYALFKYDTGKSTTRLIVMH
jgi:hypothetical protein